MKVLILLLLSISTLAGENPNQLSKYDYWGQKLKLNDWAVRCNDSLLALFVNTQLDVAPIDSNGMEIPNVFYRRVSEDGQKGWLKIGRRIKTESNGHQGLSYYNIETNLVFDLSKGQKK